MAFPVTIALLLAAPTIAAQEHSPPQTAAGRAEQPIEEVQLAPLYDQPFVCSEHPEGQLPSLGDSLGTDCMVVGGVTPAGGFFDMHRADGSRNEDWYGWHAKVHAPFAGTVKLVHVNTVTNRPGSMGTPPASVVIFQRADGMQVIYAHVEGVTVKAGDVVTAGQVVAVVGNNGMARNPHIHVGAVMDHKPLQIRWDLRAEGRIPSLVGD